MTVTNREREREEHHALHECMAAFVRTSSDRNPTLLTQELDAEGRR